MTNKGVVLLFGAFNPFTNAHLLIGKLAKEKYPEFEICYVPSRLSYMLEWKGMDKSQVMSEEFRYNLIKGSIEGIKDFSVTDIELKGIVNGKTYNTIHYFKEVLGYDEVVLCMGTDKVSELETWYKGEDLVRENKFMIVTRSGEKLASKMTDFTNLYKENFSEVENHSLESLSASYVRDLIKREEWEKVREVVPEYVYNKLI